MESARKVSVKVIFSRRSGPPLLKKISQYNSGIPLLPNYERDLPHLAALAPETFRLDLGVGKEKYIAAKIATGTPKKIAYDFSSLDRLTELLIGQDTIPYYSWCYVPQPLQREGDFRKLDQSLKDWQSIWRSIYREYAAHFKENGRRVGFHEIYNEPDLCEDFLLESWETYLQLYKHGSLGVKDGDPDAVIGGPAAAFPEFEEQTLAFARWVAQEKLPLDFFSFHHYWTGAPFAPKLDVVRRALAEDPRFATTEIHINELNYVSGWQGEDSLHNRAAVVPHIFEVIEELLRLPDVTMAHWAQFMESTFRDDAYGLIHRDGRKKAAYHAFRIYAELPVQRVQALVEDGTPGTDFDSSLPQVGCMASCHEGRAGIVVWNSSAEARKARVIFADLPFKPAEAQLYRIDAEHASWFEGASEELEAEPLAFAVAEEVWEGILPAGGMLYFLLETEARADGEVVSKKTRPAEDVRLHYYFPNRTRDNYAFFDRKAWTAYLGMGSEGSERSLVGVTAAKLPASLAVEFRTGGKRSHSADRVLGVRVDYVRAGVAESSVFFRAGDDADEVVAELPWGTLRKPDRCVAIGSASAWKLDLQAYAPADWSPSEDRAILTFELSGCESGAWAEIVVR